MKKNVPKKKQISPLINLKSVDFYVTTNPWINNGLFILAQKIKEQASNSGEPIEVTYGNDKITIKNPNNVLNSVAIALHDLAAEGTYNFSTTFKIINIDRDGKYQPPKQYPDQEGENKKTIDILDDERDVLKNKNQKVDKKQQIWKQRVSYFGSYDNYLTIGLHLKDEDVFTKLQNFSDGGKNCPVCGSMTNSLTDIKQFSNPLSGEHHNNIVEGTSPNIRKTVSACPKCVILTYFALFNRYIPFYQVPNKGTYLTLPNTTNIEILKIINNNLSLKGQFIDFSMPDTIYYSSNIKSIPFKTPSAALLALLHNVVNRYSVVREKMSFDFMNVPKERFVEMVEWLFIEKNRFSITHIRADERLYDILSAHEDLANNKKVYLVPDVLSKISFINFDENDIRFFYDGLLKLDGKKLSQALFKMAKGSVSDRIVILGYLEGGSSPLDLFKKVFLRHILGVNRMLNDDEKEACEDVAKTIGKGFSKDVGMMTKFAFAANEEDFRNAIADATFRLAKKTALNEGETYYLKEASMKLLLSSLGNLPFDEIKNYFVSFMSVNALTENYRLSKGS